GTAPDDLKPVPVQRLNGKICFYALGPVAFELTSPLTATPHFTREVNAYSTHGYYFLTEETTPELAMATSAGTTVITTPDARKTSYDFYWHERDLCSLGFSGKDLLGEDITLNGGTFDFTLPAINTLSKLYVNTAVGANISASGYVKTYLEIGGQRDTVSYTASSSKIYPPSSAYVYYNYASPTSAITPKRHNEQGVLQTMVTTSTGTIKTAKLDYFIITYERNNYLSNKDNANQFRLAFSSLTDDAQIMLPKASEDLVLWNVQVPSAPVACQLTSIPDEDQPSVINRCYAPGYASRVEYFVAFDPTAELKKISGFSRVENQDLHGMPVPDMLIVTSKELKSEAQRIADMHRDTDGIDVAVVEQDQIYNEFSSGTPDAMAVRLINKMFYDRDNNKFKYLLLFGPGSFDNRGLSTDKANRVITYESDISNDEDYSYTSDDFFGMLDDNSGNDISSDMLRLGIGRITSRDVSEAKSDVDKLIKYVTEPDYGPWRNNFMAICDEGDGGMHMFQAEGICDILTEELETGLQIEKVYSPMYPKASTLSEPGVAENERTAINAKKHLKELLATGQYFSTYVGHANPTRFSKVSNLWTIT
ncbi:MAG: hypothetical protein IK092_04405, partial [Muribaculaceae bacterium]|nr:hypothetical protein [Muribaculaceae bacterium]